MTQISGGVVEPGPDIPALAECQVPFEERDGLGEPPLTEIYPTDRGIRVDQAEGVINRLRNTEPCFCMAQRLMERPDLGKVRGQPAAREDKRKARHPKMLTGQVACERRDDLLEHLDRLTVVPTATVDVPQ